MADEGGIIVTIDPSSPGIQKLIDMAKRLEDKPKALAKLSLMMRSQVLENFKLGGRPAWAPWSERYRIMTLKEHKGKSHSLLKLTGALWKSIRPLSGTPAGVSAGGGSDATGKPVNYAADHQFGSAAKHLPARPYMMIPPEEMDKIAQSWLDWVAEGKAIG